MGDSIRVPNSNRFSEAISICSKKQSITYLAASASKILAEKAVKSITSVKQHLQVGGIAGDVVFFLAITAALEVVRRFSRARCPFVWRALRALQLLRYPPFKWIQRWHPFKELAKQTEKLSRPMLFLSIATLFSDEDGYSTEASNLDNESQAFSRSGSRPSSQTSWPETGANESADWLLQLHTELRKQGITLPERLCDDELHRFYAAVNGDFQKLISAVKKTINWRQSYKLLQPQELDSWSHLVFWHGHDTRQRPCLIIRLGLACSTLQSADMPLFVKAVVSQIEHGVLNLVKIDQPQIMVLMDCHGLSPFGFPIHTMRSCASLLQDHYPNRLGCLMIIRLPHLARVVTQALFQVLRPSTQRKVRTAGRNYREILSECLESLPSFLGGNCVCPKCLDMGTVKGDNGDKVGIPPEAEIPPIAEIVDDHISDVHLNGIINDDRDDTKRTIAVVLLILCALIFIFLGIHFSERSSFLYYQNSQGAEYI